MAVAIRQAFARCQRLGKPAFVGFLTAGFPTLDTTIPALVALQEGGADIIELGLPFSDPLADGGAIQKANTQALANGMTVPKLVQLIADARKAGVTVPIVIMGYFNPMMAYGFERFAKDVAEAGGNGFIIVDLPPEQASSALEAINRHDLGFVPLVTPTTTDERMAKLASIGNCFIYCVSVTGVTGARTNLAEDLPDFIARVRKHTQLPLAVGFGISKREHVVTVGQNADGAVVGSAIIAAVDSLGPEASPADRAQQVQALIQDLTQGKTHAEGEDEAMDKIVVDGFSYGAFGGRYIPETLVEAHEQLWEAWQEAWKDPAFHEELAHLRSKYVGGPTPLWKCERLSQACGGGEIWLKREDLAHTGAHKINNALGQVLLAKRLNKERLIAETGAGQHGVAMATACALMGIKCVVYMGEEDTQRQSLNVFRMKMLGAEVVAVKSGSRTLKDAINEAMRDWVTNVRTTHYCLGSAVGPHPFPLIVRDLQCVIGREARTEFLETTGSLPDAVIACVGGGSNAIGMFHPFVGDEGVRLIGVEAGGEHGVEGGKHSASLVAGKPGVLHGTLTYLLQDTDGQITETHSISAGLDYPGVGPEHSFLKDSGRAEYVAITDSEALDAFKQLSQLEGIIPALESSHAVAYGMKLAKTMKPGQRVLVNLSGRGDKDMMTVAKVMGVQLD
ncbi:uncharacterized protein MONBRDRAFT_26458 [Monosiga brevicollis MX1]|uniref:Tryptophan synthase n=1 Tax=Monosiga brevicollis TaxID=81824 RepID=A9V2F2_MONBE|nr:uncharacterized protein MONBRDRAFT_26458 [Monosiga brevicollis MX1]EDQ88247.1 predicted protein [Monosiga brevicollis MX1]|eukprot:XP_001746840.1 hypothetical protein [Monosiga brevicollis MX1]